MPEPAKVVARFVDGRVLKGQTMNFIRIGRRVAARQITAVVDVEHFTVGRHPSH